jgi:hypothetical protein
LLEKPKKSFSNRVLFYFIQMFSNSYVTLHLLLEGAVTKMVHLLIPNDKCTKWDEIEIG